MGLFEGIVLFSIMCVMGLWLVHLLKEVRDEEDY